MRQPTKISYENLAQIPIGNILSTFEETDLAEYFTISEFCEYFAVPVQTVRRWLRDGELPGIKLGKKWRISKATVARIEAGELKLGPKDAEGDSDDGE